MKFAKRFRLMNVVAALLAVTLVLTACGQGAGTSGNSGGNENTVTAERISTCKVEYNWGEVFDATDLAYEITYPDGTSDYATEGFTFTREGGADIATALGENDKKITVVWNGTKDDVEYTFTDTLELSIQDPHSADTLLFRGEGGDAVYMLGDGTFYACGVQAVDYKDYVAAKGYWSWDGKELSVVVTSTYGMFETYERTITVNGDASTGYSFQVYWGMFPMSINISKEQADIYFTSETKFGDTSLTKDKNYPVWDDAKDIHATEAGV